ncbi:membrane traffic protein [Lithospermum erythrorhizon]|uniref:Membrane traffic protein n=1 Tax=Lithospermum erythrorhizon TaxID=34254 RepID=A0AAV3S0S1_LITER
MVWLNCCSNCYDNVFDYEYSQLEDTPFSLPSELPKWPKGEGFGTGSIFLGELEVVQITKLEKIWSCSQLIGKSNSVSFYRPVDIPDGFLCLGHYSQSDDKQLMGYVLVAREVDVCEAQDGFGPCPFPDLPALEKPVSYTLVWRTDSNHNGHGCIWLPEAPAGYKAMGFVVTDGLDEPKLNDVRCVRADLTESCEPNESLFNTTFTINQLEVWSTRPCRRGMLCQGVAVGTFVCGTNLSSTNDMNIACLKNLAPRLSAMPNLDQIHALIKHYGPTLYFHPDENYLPSSVPWFFKNGALLFQDGKDKGLSIDSRGLILPGGGENDGLFWLDLPEDDNDKECIKCGNIESAELYVHVKPAVGGTFTDIAMWIFCPFNGPSTIKAGLWNISLGRVGEHIGDWEHYTLRISNFTGELREVYFSEHSGGEWVDASELEFIEGNKPIVYSSKDGHASFPHSGCYIQGSTALGLGVRNDCGKSKYLIDSSTRYQIIAAEYLGDEVVPQPHWLQYMREWGPTIVYDAGAELEKIISHLPIFFRFSVESLFEIFPTEIYGEEGPTGPKEKDNWFGDERC